MNLDTVQVLLVLLIVDAITDAIVSWRLIGMAINAKSQPGTPPPVVVPPVETTTPPVAPPVVVPPIVVPAPTPVPVPTPAPVAPKHTDIIATWFDDDMGAYGRIDHTKPGVALPAAVASPRPKVRVSTTDGSRSVVCDIVDKGPWNVSDPYWTTNSRPQAESGTDQRGRTTNHAGIDLTLPAVHALGFNEKDGKWVVNWDFVDARTQTSPAPAPSGPPQLVPIEGAPLQHNDWPTQAQCQQFYGSSEAEIRSKLVSVHVPWLMNGNTQTIQIHQLCAPSLNRVLTYIWLYCGKSQEKIHEFGYDVFDGSFNWRPIRGGSGLSVHSYGAAIDWDAAHNPQLAPASKTEFKEDSLITAAFKAEGWIWGGDWVTPRDAMHFQAARVR